MGSIKSFEGNFEGETGLERGSLYSKKASHRAHE